MTTTMRRTATEAISWAFALMSGLVAGANVYGAWTWPVHDTPDGIVKMLLLAIGAAQLVPIGLSAALAFYARSCPPRRRLVTATIGAALVCVPIVLVGVFSAGIGLRIL